MSNPRKFFAEPVEPALLHFAIMAGHQDAVELMLKCGYPVNRRLDRDVMEPTPKFSKIPNFRPGQLRRIKASENIAKDSREAEEAAKIKERLKKEIRAKWGESIERFFSRRPTPLHAAVASESLEMIKVVVAAGASLDEVTDDDEFTPMMMAVIGRRPDIVEFLVTSGAGLDETSKVGKTALHYTADTCQLEMARMLLENGADVNAATQNGCQPLHVAAQRRCPEMVELLMEFGGKVNATTRTGVTPLHLATAGGQKEMMESLIGEGAKVSVIYQDGVLDISPLVWINDTAKVKGADFFIQYMEREQSANKVHQYSVLLSKFIKKIMK